MAYAEHTQGRPLTHVQGLVVQRDDRLIDLPHTTRRNLELVQTLRGEDAPTLFSLLDTCMTGMGSRELKRWLLEPPRDRRIAQQRLEAIASLQDPARSPTPTSAYKGLRDALKGTGDVQRISARIALRQVRPRELNALLAAGRTGAAAESLGVGGGAMDLTVQYLKERKQFGTLIGGAPIINSVNYQQTGVIMQVTPRVNSGGLVTLDIAQEVSDVDNAATQAGRGIDSPTFQNRNVISRVVVQDGQTVGLAGLKSGAHACSEYLLSGIGHQHEFALQHVNELILFRVPVPQSGCAAGLDRREIHAEHGQAEEIAQRPLDAVAHLQRPAVELQRRRRLRGDL